MQLIVATEITNQILSLLRQAPSRDLGKLSSESMKQVQALCKEVGKVPAEHDLVSEKVRKDAEMIAGLLQVEDMEVLSDALSSLQAMCTEPGDAEKQPDPVALFFTKHKSGAAIKAMAERKLKGQSGSVERDTLVNVQKESLESFRALPADDANLCGHVRAICMEIQLFKDKHAAEATPSQLLTLEGVQHELWAVCGSKLKERVGNVIGACLDLVLEAYKQNGLVQKDDSSSAVLDMSDLLTKLRMEQVLKHIVWKECAKEVPLPIGSMLNRAIDFQEDLCDFIRFLFLCKPEAHQVFQDKLPSEPNAETLDRWVSSFKEALLFWLDGSDFSELWPEVENVFLKMASDKLRQLTLSGFQAVGDLVQRCVSGDPHLEANTKALASAKEKLPANLPFRDLMDVFFKARLNRYIFEVLAAYYIKI